jgi:hypothetical protein
METRTQGHSRTDNPPRSFQIWYYTIENPPRKSVLLEGGRGGGSLRQEIWPSVEREREYRRQRFLPGMVCPLFRVFQKVEELA